MFLYTSILFILTSNSVLAIEFNSSIVKVNTSADSVDLNDGFQFESRTAECKCGQSNVNEPFKIVGGTLAKMNAWPWMAAIVWVGGKVPFFFCGGSLINNKYILTAAHCVKDLSSLGFFGGLKNLRVYLGSNDIKSNQISQFSIVSAKTHPKFSLITLNFDVALLKLSKEVKFNDNISPVCLNQQATPQNIEAIVTGWGLTSPNALQTTNNLREVKVMIAPMGKCKNDYSAIKIMITPNMLCARRPGKDSCKGDSGGPMVIQNGDSFNQIGIVSFGESCALPEFPGVYTKVSRFISWIKQNTKDASFCSNSFS